MSSSRGEIATKLSILSVLLLILGLVVGSGITSLSSRTTYAASTCAYTFGNPTLTQLDGQLICTVPTSGENIPTIGCSLAENNQWAADSKLLNGAGTTMRFELTLYEGKGPGTYDLIAYEFDQYCSHEDKAVQVAVTSNALRPTPTITPRRATTPLPTATPTIVPACIAEGTGECMSQALCLAGATNQNLGDLGCSALRSDWVCCQVPESPTRTQLPSSTPIPTQTPVPTSTPIPTADPLAPAADAAAKNVAVVRSETCTDIQIAANNRQSWAYRIAEDGVYEIVPVIGSLQKQQVVDPVCE